MNIKEIIIKLNEKETCAFQLTKRRGILTSTWLIYKRENDYYFFDINEKIIFNEIHKYSLSKLELEFQRSYFEIDCEV